MNEYFMNKVKTIRDAILYVPANFSHCHKIMEEKTCKLSLSHVQVKRVKELLKNLKIARLRLAAIAM
jgi:hypothetical protein